MPFANSAQKLERIIFGDSDSDSDSEVKLDALLAQAGTSCKALMAQSKAGRRIAGNKRVARYRELQGFNGAGTVMQSICACPALRQTSFEELRVECYLQTLIARGTKPDLVDPVSTPWAVIPPVFNAFKDDSDDQDADMFLSDVIMGD
ncbi:hypothetical protein CVT26_012950 [Gymnopilus dilepis]|uniref:Uncharacterized protein n=1 Tax=Gymnopilus dilepis TaxID=231916 RepID=A0A409WVM3_9AGAR|nr:hypothetical protein CVT26_012950 [Gymnopilus dilepis]